MDLTVNRLTVRGSMDASGSESKRLHEKIVSGRDVLIRQHRNNLFYVRHEDLRSVAAGD
jgi:hypothetical protein